MPARAESAYEPRSFLADPARFGRAYATSLRAGIAVADAAEVAASVAQHRAACVLVQMRDQGAFTSRDLAERLGVNEGMLSRYLTGAAPLSLVGLFGWALELGDPSILPDLDEVYAETRSAVTR